MNGLFFVVCSVLCFLFLVLSSFLGEILSDFGLVFQDIHGFLEFFGF